MPDPQYVTILRDSLTWDEGGILPNTPIDYIEFAETLNMGNWSDGMVVEFDGEEYTVDGRRLVSTDGKILGLPPSGSVKLVPAWKYHRLRYYNADGRFIGH